MSKIKFKELKASEEVFNRILPGFKIESKKKFNSPFRLDRDPSCTISRAENGTIYLKDWTTGESFSAVDAWVKLNKGDLKSFCDFIESEFPEFVEQEPTETLQTYLAAHGITEQELKTAGVKTSSSQVSYPISSLDGQLVGYKHRKMGVTKKERFYSDRGISPVKYIYCPQLVSEATKLIIAAGEIDSLNLALGFPGAQIAGVLGESNIPSDLLELSKRFNDIYICFDNPLHETANFENVLKLAEKINKPIKVIQWIGAFKGFKDVSEIAAKKGRAALVQLFEQYELCEPEQDDHSEALQILQAASAQITASEVFGGYLGTQADLWASETSKPVEFLINSILATTSALIGKTFVIEPLKGWVIPSILWFINLGEASSGKTPALRVATQAINQWQASEFKNFEARKAAHEQDLEAYNSLDKQSKQFARKPELVGAERYLVKSFTMEALRRLQGFTGKRESVLVAKDEGAGLFNGLNQYKGGKGSDMEALLELFNGDPEIIDRVGEDPIYFDSLVSLIIGLHPETYATIAKNDHQGLTARFLVSKPQRKPLNISTEVKNNLAEYLEVIYSKIRDLQNLRGVQNKRIHLSLAPETLKAFNHLRLQIDQEISETSNNRQYQAFLGKLVDHFCRLLISLHVLDCVQDPNLDQIPSIVSSETFLKALRLAVYYKSQAYINLARNREESELVKFIELCKSKGGKIKGKDALRAGLCKAGEAEELFKGYEVQGLGKLLKRDTRGVFFELAS